MVIQTPSSAANSDTRWIKLMPIVLTSLFLLAACGQTTEAPAPEEPVAADTEADTSPPSQLTVHPLPIEWNDEREVLTVAYRAAHQASTPGTATIEPRVVVLHWTAGNTVQSAFSVFNPVRLQGRPELSGASALNVSAHFVVDQDGTIHQLLPTTTMARHVIGLNHISIGIENVGGTSDLPLTQAQIDANIALVEHLSRQHDVEWLIGHHEYQQMQDTPLWDELDPTYRTTKVDPGDEFVHAVWAGVDRPSLQRAPMPSAVE